MRNHVTYDGGLKAGRVEGRNRMNNEIVPGFDEEKTDSLSIRLQRIEEEKGCLALYLTGQVDTYNSAGLQKKIAIAIEAGFVCLIFNMSGLHYVSSAGIGVFASLLRTLRPRNGDVVMSNPQPRVYEVFRLLGFSNFFTWLDSLDESVAHFTRRREEETAGPFPKTFQCPLCERRLRAVKAGKYRCPECKTVLVLNPTGAVLFV
jgi:anti-sigma B factor antagonist